MALIGIAGAAILIARTEPDQRIANDVPAPPTATLPAPTTGSPRLDLAPRSMKSPQPSEAPPSVTPTETSTPSPTASRIPESPTPVAASRYVLFQIASSGGLTHDSRLRQIPSETPWFTLFDDGSYIRIDHNRGDEYSLERLAGHLDETSMRELVRTLEDEVQFFDLTDGGCCRPCPPDVGGTHVHLSLDGRRHDLRVHGIGVGGARGGCGTATDLRFGKLARLVARLSQPIPSTEYPYLVERGTLVVTEIEPDVDAQPWPFPVLRLAGLPGDFEKTVALEGDLARSVAQAIEEHAYHGSNVARFVEGDTVWLTGFRLEFDGWDAYIHW